MPKTVTDLMKLDRRAIPSPVGWIWWRVHHTPLKMSVTLDTDGAHTNATIAMRVLYDRHTDIWQLALFCLRRHEAEIHRADDSGGIFWFAA